MHCVGIYGIFIGSDQLMNSRDETMDEVRKQFDSELDKFLYGGLPSGDYVQTPMDMLIRRKVAELIAIDGFIENPEAGLVHPLAVETIDAEFINSRIKSFGKVKHFPVAENLCFRIYDPILKKNLHKHDIKSLTEVTRRMAYAFFLVALNADANGDAHYATFAFSEGCLRLGFLLGLGESIVRKNKNKVNAARGGNEKSSTHSKPIHDILERLLLEKAPDEGWRSKANVSRTLLPLIIKESFPNGFKNSEAQEKTEGRVDGVITRALKPGRKNTKHILDLFVSLKFENPHRHRRSSSIDQDQDS